MLKDTEQSDMDEYVVNTPGEKSKQFLLCKLCHCEFTNFKEHVKSLVHLDARETKLNTKQAMKHKIDNSESEVNAKKSKAADEEVSINEDKSTSVKGSNSNTQSEIGAETTAKSSIATSEKEPASEENTTGGTKTDLNEKAETVKDGEKAETVKDSADTDEGDLTKQQKEFLLKHWSCSLCVHVHRAEDESFEDHALKEDHQMAHEARLAAMKRHWAWRKSRRWIYVCHACQFRTNDKDPFLTHVQEATHDANVTAVLEAVQKAKKPDQEKAADKDTPTQTTNGKTDAAEPKQANKPAGPSGTATQNQKNQNQNKQNTNQKNQNQNKPNTNQKNQNQNKQNTNQKNQNKQNASSTGKSAVQNVRPNAPQKSAVQGPSKKPAYKNLPGRKNSPARLQQNASRAPQSSANRNIHQSSSLGKPQQNVGSNAASKNFTQNQGWSSNVASHIGKPGVLGEYRPSYGDDFNRDDRIGRPDAYSGLGSGMSHLGRTQSSTLQGLSQKFGADRRDSSLSTSLSPGLGSDFRRDFGRSYSSERHDQGFSRQKPLLETPVGKLRSDPAPYRGAGSDLSPRHFTRPSDLSPTRSRYLPTNVSLDLASTSSLRLGDMPYNSSPSPSFGPRYDLDRSVSYDYEYDQQNFRGRNTSSLFTRR